LIKLFLKKFALRRLIKTVAPVYHAVARGVFAQAFFEKACGQAFFKKSLLLAEFYKVTYLKDS